MRLHSQPLLLIATVLLTACATPQVERGKDLSSAGIAYAKATAAVIDLAVDASIDASSHRLVSVVARKAKDDGEAEARKQSLKERNAELIAQAQGYAAIKRSVGAVEAYFAGLQQLAGATPGDAAEAATKNLADRVNGTSVALGGEPKLNDDRKGAVAGLAKLLVKQAHGAAVGRALERDAAVIGRALALQEISLQVALRDVQALADEQGARFQQRRVLDPYGAGEVGAEWVTDRRTYIKAQALGNTAQAVKSAAQAAAHMQDVWGRVLSGESSGAEFNLMLRDVNEALDSAIALKKAF